MGLFKSLTSLVAQPTARQIKGAEGEKLALEYLTQQGLKHVASNVRYKQGELDLVMLESGTLSKTGGMTAGKTLVFVEVRSRSSTTYGGAAASVNPGKQRRLIAAAELYLQEHHLQRPPPCRFDVVTVDGEGRIEWLRDAFQTG